MGSSLFSAWLNDDATAVELVGSRLRTVEQRRRTVEAAAQRRIDPAVLTALRAFEAELPSSPARTAHLEALGRGGVAAIVTGQQMGLFLGPLYTFYKAASAISLARALERETGTRCVPVFWLQTEDHDYAEINHCDLPGPRRIGLPDDGRRVSVAHRLLGAEMNDALDELAHALGELPHAGELLDLVRAAYRPDRTVAAAFTHLLAMLFAEEGLVLVDPRSPPIAAAMQPLLRRSVREHVAIEAGLAERSSAIEAAGFDVQVPVRAGSPLACWHTDGIDGPRYRLGARDGGRFELLGADGHIDTATLADAPPLRLSTTALLRPVVQDALLPAAVYVGGPGELAYFAQLEPLYRYFDVPRSAFALRARLRLVDGPTRSLLARVGLTAADVEVPREALLARVARSDHPSPETLSAQLLEGLHRALAELAERAPAIDPNLQKAIERTRGTVDHAVGRLVDRYDRARLDKDRVAVERVERLRAVLFPDDQPQERLLGLPYFVAGVGVEAFKAAVLRAIDPSSPAVVEIAL